MKRKCNILKVYPIIIIPIETIMTNVTNNSFLTTLLNITKEGNDKVVTAIINESTVPVPPL